MKPKKEKVFARITEQEHSELLEMSNVLDVPVSYIVREGLRERMAMIRITLKNKGSGSPIKTSRAM